MLEAEDDLYKYIVAKYYGGAQRARMGRIGQTKRGISRGTPGGELSLGDRGRVVAGRAGGTDVLGPQASI